METEKWPKAADSPLHGFVPDERATSSRDPEEAASYYSIRYVPESIADVILDVIMQ